MFQSYFVCTAIRKTSIKIFFVILSFSRIYFF
nr:MAG TPA: hypothetical protein [Caudoviricetes sp.]